MKKQINLTVSEFKKWLRALKSNKFKKTTGAFFRKNDWDGECSHCVLGVLCDINGVLDQDDPNRYHKAWQYVREKFPNYLFKEVYRLNDTNKKMTFPELAVELQARYKPLGEEDEQC